MSVKQMSKDNDWPVYKVLWNQYDLIPHICKVDDLKKTRVQCVCIQVWAGC